MKLNKKLVLCALAVASIGVVLTGCVKKDAEPTLEVTTDNENVKVNEDKTGDGAVEEENAETDSDAETEEGDKVEEDAETEEVAETESSKLYATLVDGLEKVPSQPIPTEMLSDLYNITPESVKSYHIEMPMMNVHADEVAIFEHDGSDEAKQVILDAIQFRQDSLVKTWESYLPEQLEAVQNSQTVEKGNFILYTIGSNSDKIVEKFNNSVN